MRPRIFPVVDEKSSVNTPAGREPTALRATTIGTAQRRLRETAGASLRHNAPHIFLSFIITYSILLLSELAPKRPNPSKPELPWPEGIQVHAAMRSPNQRRLPVLISIQRRLFVGSPTRTTVMFPAGDGNRFWLNSHLFFQKLSETKSRRRPPTLDFTECNQDPSSSGIDYTELASDKWVMRSSQIRSNIPAASRWPDPIANNP